MKKIIILFVFCSAVTALQAQSFTNTGINSGSGAFSNANNSISFSIGQSIIGSYSTTNSLLTNGTLQPDFTSAILAQGSFPAAQCGYISNIPTGNIICNSVVGASGYIVKFYAVGSIIVYAQKNIIGTSITFSGLTPALQGGTQYDVTVTPIMPVGFTGVESAKCRMGLIATPTPQNIAPTQLKSPVCQSVAALAPTLASTAVITCTTVTQAGGYEFKFVNVANASNTVTALASYVNQRTLAPLGLTAGATYAVSARAKVGGVWAANFGQNCFIKISQPAPSVPQGGRLGVQSTSVSTTSPWGGLEGLSVSVFPNPFSSEFTLNVSSAKVEVVSVVINDVTGKTVYSQKANTNTLITINDAQLQSGIYFVNVRSIDGSSVVRKIIKTN